MPVFEFTEDFRKSLRILSSDVQVFVKEKLVFFASNENPIIFAKRLKGVKDIYRFRIGNYRAVFRVEGSVYIFLIVKNRRDVYQGLSV